MSTSRHPTAKPTVVFERHFPTPQVFKNATVSGKANIKLTVQREGSLTLYADNERTCDPAVIVMLTNGEAEELALALAPHLQKKRAVRSGRSASLAVKKKN